MFEKLTVIIVKKYDSKRQVMNYNGYKKELSCEIQHIKGHSYDKMRVFFGQILQKIINKKIFPIHFITKLVFIKELLG